MYINVTKYIRPQLGDECDPYFKARIHLGTDHRRLKPDAIIDIQCMDTNVSNRIKSLLDSDEELTRLLSQDREVLFIMDIVNDISDTIAIVLLASVVYASIIALLGAGAIYILIYVLRLIFSKKDQSHYGDGMV